MNKSILVVGGAGYIGSHMTLMLAEAGYKVTVFDNLFRGHRDAVLVEDFVQGDLRIQEDLQRLFHGRSFDLVMHFAALAYVGESVAQPVHYYANNVAGSINLLEAMARAGVKRIVFSSTCATYGVPVAVPMTEEHPQLPINPYGQSKLMVEKILTDCAAGYGLESIALRYFNAAGCDPESRLGERHNPETHLIPLVLQEALRIQGGASPEQTQLKVFGDDFATLDGTCVRDYIHVQDLCSAHLAAAGRLLAGRCGGAEVYNLGNGAGFSVKEVIDACCAVTGCDIRYEIVGRRPGDPAQLVGSADKARSVLGWEPKICRLKDIIRTAWVRMQKDSVR